MPDKEELPAEPYTFAEQGAINMHEIYLAYQAAGFTKEEAMQVVIAILQRPV